MTRLHSKYGHSLLIFGVQETLYYLNVVSRNRMPHFRRHVLGHALLGEVQTLVPNNL